jgi:hypothetical protein
VEEQLAELEARLDVAGSEGEGLVIEATGVEDGPFDVVVPRGDQEAVLAGEASGMPERIGGGPGGDPGDALPVGGAAEAVVGESEGGVELGRPAVVADGAREVGRPQRGLSSKEGLDRFYRPGRPLARLDERGHTATFQESPAEAVHHAHDVVGCALHHGGPASVS